MKPKTLFQEVPEDLAELSKDELAELQASLRETAQHVKDNDEELIGELSAEEVLEQAKVGKEGFERIAAEITARVDAEQNFETEKAEVLDFAEETVEVEVEVEVAEDAEAEEADAEVEGAEEVEEVDEVEVEVPVAASAAKRYAIPKASQERRPHASKPGGFTASAGLSGFKTGSEMSREDVAQAIISARQATVATGKGIGEKVIVASAQADFPEDRYLRVREGALQHQSKIDKVLQGANLGHPSPEIMALTAAGECLCGPVSPYYGQLDITSGKRPVRDALAAFRADRGGIQFVPPPSLASITGVGVVTSEDCEAGGSSAAKTCQTVDCVAVQEVDVASVYRCLTFQNLASRAAPEVVTAWTDLANAAWAALAEGLLLDGIAASSTAVTSTGPNGAINSLLGDIIVAAAGLRSRHRMEPDAPLRVMLPSWTPDLLTLDLARSANDRFSITQAGIAALLSKYNVTPTFYLDEETGGAQIIGVQNAGVLNLLPTALIWYIFPEGSFLFLDAGRLDLGIVRDSTLNTSNEYQIFAESFENVAFVGVESLKVTSTVCPSGETALPSETNLACAAAHS